MTYKLITSNNATNIYVCNKRERQREREGEGDGVKQSKRKENMCRTEESIALESRALVR